MVACDGKFLGDLFAPDQADQERLELKDDQLLASKRGILAPAQLAKYMPSSGEEKASRASDRMEDRRSLSAPKMAEGQLPGLRAWHPGNQRR